MTTTSTDRATLHALIERLPDSELAAAIDALQALQARHDPVLRAFLAAPADDEPLTDEDIAAIEEARAEVAAGLVMDWEEYKARYGSAG